MKRSSIIRIIRLAEYIHNNPYQNVIQLAKDLEVSGRTIKRDISVLRSEYEAPIQYDYFKKGYFFTRFWHFSLPDLTEGEVITLLLATSIMKQFSGTHLGTSLKSIENKIAILFKDKITLSPNDLSLLVSAQTSPIQMIKDIQPIFNCIFQSISKKKTITIHYHTISTGKTLSRKVDPYHLFYHQGVWYFCGYCHKRKEVRDFALDRILSCSMTTQHFSMPDEFHINEYLQNAFRIIKGKSETITIHFDAYQAKWIRERIWHPTQKMKELPNGELLLTLYTEPKEIKQWVMSYGNHAEIIKPKKLRDEIRNDLKKILQKYTKEQK